MPETRCYTVQQVCEKLQLARATFFELRAKGRIPCLEELRPRIGRRVRYRADLIDRYLEGEGNRHRRSFRGVA